MGSWLAPVDRALDRAHDRVHFFCRDDDVGWDAPRLWKVLDLFAEHELPVDLAVIPNELGDDVARGLLARVHSSPRRIIGLHQHGFAHVNHEAAGRKHEFGPSRSARLQWRDIADGQRVLEDLLGPSVDAIFTPPWNRCTEATGRCLVDLGFEVLSREARAVPLGVPELAELPVRIDWFAHRKHVRLSRAELGAMIADAIRDGGQVGIMFHHALMDADERAAAGELLSLIASHPAARAGSMIALADAATAAER